jgi:hypothetical protein
MSSVVNDYDDFDTDDEEFTQEVIRDKTTRESFLSLIDSASVGADLIQIINLLPNSSQRYGHSLTMNAVVKIITRSSTFKDRCTAFYTMKMKGGKETRVVSTYNILNQSNKENLRAMMREITPVNGPWFEVIQLLCHCDEVFNESAAAVTQKGMPTNRIACISHMLCDEKFLACIIPLTDVVEPAARPAELDQIKATGKTKIDAVYADIHKSYKTWIKDYKNPFVDGLWAEDLGAIQPHLATFKDGDAIRALVRSTVQKVETILKNHKQSGHHSSGDDRLLEIKNSFITHKGRNVDIGNFYTFLMLETKDLKFASRSLQPGVGASAGLGTVGGGAAAMTNRKRDASDAAMLQIDMLMKRLSDNSDRLTNETEKAMVRLFSPSPTFTDISNSGGGGESYSYLAARESKVVMERKLLCVKEQIEYYKYVLLSDCYDGEEKKKAKKDLADLMLELKEMTK